MTTFTLTTGADTIVGTPADDTVEGTAATLNATDSLDGGGGYNTLALFGSGTFDLSSLAQFVNFQEVDVTNITGGQSNLTLGNGIGLTVNVDNESGSGGTINLADSAVTLNLGSSANYTVYASTGAAAISTSTYDGRFFLSSGDATVTVNGYANYIWVSSGKATVDLSNSFAYNYIFIQDVGSINYNDDFIGGNTNYLYVDGSGHELDLTKLSLINNNWYLYIGYEYSSSNVTVDVDSSSLSHFSAISGNNNEKLQTAAATLDLTHTSVTGSIAITSTNATGTTFTVADLTTAEHVIGSPGNDTLVAQSFTFTAGQRAAIFAQGSVETIVDSSGAYGPDGSFKAPPAHSRRLRTTLDRRRATRSPRTIR
jgi:hypothetical protein